MNKFFIIAVLLVASVTSSEAFFSWLFGWRRNGGDEQATLESEKGGLITTKTVPFDMKTADDNFLSSAELSPLDTCHHNVRIQPA